MRAGSKSERKTVRGGTNRTDTRGRTEKRTDTTVPISKPNTIDFHDKANPISNGINPFIKKGMICWIPTPRNEPITLPIIPRRKIWIKKMLNACHPVEPTQRSTATSSLFSRA
jgi:hypothetical protein